jgi:hypothetical protein
MSFVPLRPVEAVFQLEVNSKVLDKTFAKLVDAQKAAADYEAQGFQVIIQDGLTGHTVKSNNN